MLSVNDLSINFGGNVLFSRVDLQFTPGSCYGIIGANGAVKSTFIKILSGELEPSTGTVTIAAKKRMSVLKQNQNMYDDYTVMDTVIMGNQRLYDCGKEKDAIYDKPDFDDADGIRAAELEEEFAELGGWEAESDASRILQGLGVSPDFHETMMRDMDPRLKVKVLLAQALFGKPDIVMLDEPTNNLDIEAINWLEDFILDYEDTGLVIVVSHDRHFLNTVCTHIVDIDYGKIKMYVGNYDFWYESSQLIQQLIRNKNKRAEEKIAELQTFIARFAANKAKSKQATSRRKLIDKLTVEELPASSRKYPYIAFDMEREVGKDILFVTDVSKTIDGVKLLDKVSFIVNKNDKIAFVGENELAQTALFKILMGELEPDEGSVKWGQTVTTSYLPKDNTEYFEGCTDSLVDWIRQFSSKKDDVYLRGFLGRMLFSGDDVFKPVNVLSGGEKVRKIVLIVAVVVFVVTIGVLISQLAGMGADKSTNSKIADIAGVPEDSLVNVNPDYDPFNTNATAGQDQTEEIDVTPLVNTPINPNWDELLATNSDVKGWIKITGTAVNNVVVKSYDNSYYLTHNLYREDSVSGTIFSSYLNKWDGTDDNIILYGHNMISGEFFAHVTHYVPNMASKEPLAFYKVHPTVMLATPSGGCETYKIFAGILANTQSQYGEVFDYVDKTKFYSKDDFNNFIIDVMDRSWFFTDVDLTYGDQLLTLSTCSWPLGKSVDTRWVLFARKVRPGESESVDVTVAEQNLNPKLFDYYYSRMGGSWAGSTWDKSKLLSY